MRVKAGHKYDDIVDDAIIETIGESAHEDPARLAAQDLVRQGRREHLADRDANLDQKLLPEAFTCVFVLSVRAPDIFRRRRANDVRTHP